MVTRADKVVVTAPSAARSLTGKSLKNAVTVWFECPTDTTMQAVSIWRMRLKIDRLCSGLGPCMGQT